MGALRYLWQQIRGVGAPVPAMAAALGARIGLTLASPWLVGRFLDGVERHQRLSDLEPWAVLFLAAALLTPAAAYATDSLALSVEWTVANRLRERLASIALALPLLRHRAMTPGEVVERLDGDVSALGALLSNLGLQVVGSAGQALAALVGLMVMNRTLGLLLASLAALVAWMLEWFRRRTVPLVQAERQANADTYGLLGELVAAKEDLATEGATAYALARLARRQRKWHRQCVRAELSGYLAWALTLGAFGLGDGMAYWVSGRLYLGTHLPLGTVYILVAYVGLLAAPLSSLREQVQELQRGQGSLHRVMAWDQRRDEPPLGTCTLPPGPLAVAVSGVSWRHDGVRGIHDLSFALRPGGHLGVVGPSGAGKSTLAALLVLLATPEAGIIRLGDAPISQLDPADVRRRVAYLPQTPALFAASLLDNLTMFDRTVPPERAAEALAAVGLAPWRDCLAHPVDRSALSAGQRELLALARVWMGNPGLVVLDEPLSRLGGTDRAVVARALERLLAGRTAVIVAHRLMTLVDSNVSCSGACLIDEILVLDQGRRVEWGPLPHLLRDPTSRFAQLLAREQAADGGSAS